MTDQKKSEYADLCSAEAILEIGWRCAVLPDLELRSHDEILGYNEFDGSKGSMAETEASILMARVKRIRKNWR